MGSLIMILRPWTVVPLSVTESTHDSDNLREGTIPVDLKIISDSPVLHPTAVASVHALSRKLKMPEISHSHMALTAGVDHAAHN